MSNPIANFMRAQDDRERLLKVEQLRRQGETFIKVKYIGPVVPQVDSDGLCYNLRLHGLKDIEAYEQTDINSGRTEWKGRKGARMVSFYQSTAGDIETDVWDDPDHWNRRFIATHKNELYVDSVALRSEIMQELEKPFKAEKTRKEELENIIAESAKELESIIHEEKKVGKKKQSGVNKSTSDLDSPGVSRVATRRAGKRDTTSLQPSAQNT